MTGAARQVESERRLQAIVDAAAGAVVTIDEKGTIGSFNRATERLFGHDAPEMLGRNVNVLIPSPWREAVLRAAGMGSQ